MEIGDSPKATATTSKGARLLDALDGIAPEEADDEIIVAVVEDGGGVNNAKPVVKTKAPSNVDGSGNGAKKLSQMSPQERWEVVGRLRSEATREFMAGNRERSRELYERAAALTEEGDAAALVDEATREFMEGNEERSRELYERAASRAGGRDAAALADEGKREMWEMSPKQRLEKASALKEEGTKEFMAGNHEAAANIYKKAAGFVDSLQNDDEKDMFVKCHVNAAMCHVKTEDWSQVISCCNRALYEIPEEARTNVKALYRRGLAKMHTGELKGAKADFVAAYRIDSKDKAVIKAIQELKAKSAEEAEAKKRRKEEKKAKAEKKKRAQLEKNREIDVYGDYEEGVSAVSVNRDSEVEAMNVAEAGSDGAFNASGPPSPDISVARDHGAYVKNILRAASGGAFGVPHADPPSDALGSSTEPKEAAAFAGGRYKHMWELTPEERLERASEYKEEGAKEFTAGDHAGAADFYKRAAGFIDVCQNEDEKEMFVKCYLNAAMCYVKANDWLKVISCCNKVFEKIPDEAKTNVKALYRRGLAKMHTGELKGAKADLMAAHEIDGKNRDVRRAIQELRARGKEAKEKDRARFGGMFGGDKAGT